MKKLAFMLFVALLGCGFAQDSNDSHQTSSEWEVIDFMQGDEVERKKQALDSCYTTQNSAQNCAKILSDWESLCAYNGTKYCLALYVIYAEIYESLRKDKESLNKIIATLRRQCDSNEANACLALGEYYARNEEKPKNSLPYFQKACDLGASMGCEFIVSRYFGGYLKHFDKAQIKRYFDKGLQIAKRDCQRGEKTACEMIRYKYEPLQQDMDSANLPPIASDWEYLAYSFSWELEYFNDCMKKYAKHCDEILLTISNLCDEGEGKYCVAKGVIIYFAEDKDKGIAILQKSCDSGYVTACAELGRILIPIPNQNKPAKKAEANKRKDGIAYTKKACDLGSYLGCEQLAETYYLGLDDEIPKDKQRAQLYFDKALQIAKRDCQRKDGWASPFSWQNEACKAIKDLDKLKGKIDLMK